MAVCELCEQEVGLAYSCMKSMEGQISFRAELRPAIAGPRAWIVVSVPAGSTIPGAAWSCVRNAVDGSDRADARQCRTTAGRLRVPGAEGWPEVL